MITPTPDNPFNVEHLAEAHASKRRVRRELESQIESHLEVHDPMLDAPEFQTSLFDELPWRDPSPSGEFDAVHA